MVIDISVGIIAAAFVVLVVFLIRALLNVNKLAVGINRKSDALDYLISPFLRKKRKSATHKADLSDNVAGIIEGVANGMQLFSSIKKGLKKNGKKKRKTG